MAKLQRLMFAVPFLQISQSMVGSSNCQEVGRLAIYKETSPFNRHLEAGARIASWCSTADCFLCAARVMGIYAAGGQLVVPIQSSPSC